MTSAWFVGARRSVDQEVSTVRSTLDPERTDASPELHSEPEWNQASTDDSAQLTGLSLRNVSGDEHESTQYVPGWVDGASQNHNAIIDNQVSSSGSAASREASGVQGHGTMDYTVSIEPVIREGSRLGDEAFVFDQRNVQEGSGAYMNPAVGESADGGYSPGSQQWSAVAQAFAEKNARNAYAASLFQNWTPGE